jgi:hypothetical protein
LETRMVKWSADCQYHLGLGPTHSSSSFLRLTLLSSCRSGD